MIKSEKQLDLMISTILQQYPEACLDCGICCGTCDDVSHISISVKEKRKYEREYELNLTEDKKALKVPCQFHKDKKCTIYNIRPRHCKTYPFNANIMPFHVTLFYTCKLGALILKDVIKFYKKYLTEYGFNDESVKEILSGSSTGINYTVFEEFYNYKLNRKISFKNLSYGILLMRDFTKEYVAQLKQEYKL